MTPGSGVPRSEELIAAAHLRRSRLGSLCEPILILDPDNVFWLTGIWDLRGKVSLVFDRGTWNCIARGPSPAVPPGIKDLPVTVIGVGWEGYRELLEGGGPVHIDQEPEPALRAAVPSRRWISATSELEAERQIKDDVEVEIVKWNVSVLNNALKAVARLIEPGRSELDIWFELGRMLRNARADGLEVTGNLASGARTLEDDPHVIDKTIETGDLVLLDAYPRLGGYYADLTRTWLCGSPPAELARVHGGVCRALEAVAAQLRPGAVGGALDRLARQALEASGVVNTYSHHTGHGFGVKQQESPWLRPDSQDSLEAGMIVAVEPASYIPGVGGIRLEQDFLITDDGASPLGDTTFSLEPGGLAV